MEGVGTLWIQPLGFRCPNNCPQGFSSYMLYRIYSLRSSVTILRVLFFWFLCQSSIHCLQGFSDHSRCAGRPKDFNANYKFAKSIMPIQNIFALMHGLNDNALRCIVHQSDPEGFSYILLIIRTYCERAPMRLYSMCPPQSFNANAQCVPLRASMPVIDVSPSELQCQ